MQAIGDKVLNVANMSTEQSTTLVSRMDSILELLQRLTPAEISQPREAETKAHEAVESSAVQEIDEQIAEPSNDCLEDALDRLSSLVKEKEQTFSSSEAESIIEDVEKILVYLQKAEKRSKDPNSWKKRKKACDEIHASDDEDVQYQHDVKRMKRILSASDRIALREKGIQFALQPDSCLTKTSQHGNVRMLQTSISLSRRCVVYNPPGMAYLRLKLGTGPTPTPQVTIQSQTLRQMRK